MTTPEEKAWNLVKELLQDEKKYQRLKHKKYIALNGNNGLVYILYPSGKIVKLEDFSPKQGTMHFRHDLVQPDHLATLIAWITYNAEEFEKYWGCGNLELEQHLTIEQQQEREQQREKQRLQNKIYLENRKWYNEIGFNEIISIAITVLIITPVLLLTPKIMEEVSKETFFGNSTGSTALTDLSPMIITLLPLILVLGVVLTLTKTMRY